MLTIQEEFSIIKNFVRIMSERTGGTHNLVTALTAGLLGERLGLSFKELYLSGLFHDIGGIGIFESLVTEPISLQRFPGNDEELLFHPVVSYRMVKDFLGLDLPCIREHHEFFNGSGYPGERSRDEITISGYILGISDKFEILARSAHYNYHEIITTIKEWRDRWYPHHIVDEILCLLSEDRALLYDIQQLVSLEQRLSYCEKRHDFSGLKIDEMSLLKFFSMAITLKHPYTSQHSERVSNLSLNIGRRMGLDSESLNILKLSAFLHDIGKVCIPRGVLNKPSALTPSEARIIKEHTLKTYEILNNSSITENIAFIAASHHEQMDGSGYPLGLKGEEIPVMSRIINIADIFDALTSSRAYREALSKEMALKIMEDEFKGKLDYSIFMILKDLREDVYHGL